MYISFPTAFWLEEADSRPPDEQFTGHVQFLSPRYAATTNPARWTQESIDLSTMPHDVAHPTILFYIYGEQSIKLAEDLRSLSSAEAQQQFLIDFYEPYFSRLPNYVKGAQQCTPIDCLATSWVTDELAGNGSYTYVGPT